MIAAAMPFVLTTSLFLNRGTAGAGQEGGLAGARDHPPSPGFTVLPGVVGGRLDTLFPEVTAGSQQVSACTTVITIS